MKDRPDIGATLFIVHKGEVVYGKAERTEYTTRDGHRVFWCHAIMLPGQPRGLFSSGDEGVTWTTELDNDARWALRAAYALKYNGAESENC